MIRSMNSRRVLSSLLVDPLAGSITGANGIYERLPLWLRGIVLRPNAAFVFVHVVVSEVRQSGRNEPGEPQLVLPEPAVVPNSCAKFVVSSAGGAYDAQILDLNRKFRMEFVREC